MSETPPKALATKLHPLTVEVLKRLGDQSETEFVIGGGVALCHYVSPRDTFDLDGWWKTEESEATIRKLEVILNEIAKREQLELRINRFNDVISLELIADSQKKVYSVQVAKRDRYLDSPVLSEWNVPIETLRDNIGSKMKALINRGTPRDFLDIHKICTEGKATAQGCWDIASQVISPWAATMANESNTKERIQQGKAEVAHHLLQIETRKPLPPEMANESDQIKNARSLRNWFKTHFLTRDPDPPRAHNQPEPGM
jgi:hypothetical protein